MNLKVSQERGFNFEIDDMSTEGQQKAAEELYQTIMETRVRALYAISKGCHVEGQEDPTDEKIFEGIPHIYALMYSGRVPDEKEVKRIIEQGRD